MPHPNATKRFADNRRKSVESETVDFARAKNSGGRTAINVQIESESEYQDDRNKSMVERLEVYIVRSQVRDVAVGDMIFRSGVVDPESAYTFSGEVLQIWSDDQTLIFQRAKPISLGAGE